MKAFTFNIYDPAWWLGMGQIDDELQEAWMEFVKQVLEHALPAWEYVGWHTLN